ncbi:MAG: hypothetical protein UFX20_07150 [Longibaculum muris]|uniref:Uncharacterized protein n=1 Tax=Longibaculum muris TaxID=1796628 RepID=A0A4R3YVW9_9FIRM|nr:hypothetical protein [Longibaculum muris]KXU50930.1 hypothetical protein HMPREF3037_01107 [Candidatus Stoquefichus sp. KLE1796]MCR1889491.1 hypothetical protein [Longibaculum muris]MED9811857.1 hypothetical protein [Longibaculum muris]TCV95393.1 hypothetical protein EDD60_11754 [Longibaculum muris]
MKRMIVFALLLSLLVGCQKPVKEDKPEEKTEELFNTDGYSSTLGIQDIKVIDNLVELTILYERSPIGLDHMIMVTIDDQFVPFSFDKNGDFEYQKKMKIETEQFKDNKFYVQTTGMKKNQTYNFSVIFIDNYNYVAENVDNPDYSDYRKSQNIAHTVRRFECSQDVKALVSNKKGKKVKWETVKNNSSSFQNNYYGYEDKNKLKQVFDGDLQVMKTPAIPLKKGEDLKWSFAIKSEYIKKGAIYFFVDNQFLTVDQDYGFGCLDYKGQEYGLSQFDIQLPNNIEKGKHTFYFLILDCSESKYAIVSLMSELRLIVVE